MAKVLLYVNMPLVAGTMAATLPASPALSHAELEASRLGKCADGVGPYPLSLHGNIPSKR